MFIKFRLGVVSDLQELSKITRRRFGMSQQERVSLVEFWTNLLVEGLAVMPVIEMTDASGAERIVFFKIFGMLTVEFAACLQSSSLPFIGQQLHQMYRQGELPVLSRSEVARANARDGVNGCTMFMGVPEDILNGPELAMIAAKIVDYNYFAVGGFNLKMFFVEENGPFEWSWADGFGLKVCRDYSEQQSLATCPPGLMPRLYFMDRATANERVGTGAASLFHCGAPVFGFTPAEQDLLLSALCLETDKALSSMLSVALITVRKRWAGIYDRVADVAPTLLGEDSSNAKRGAEKKRRLLTYLRNHMEELRPYEHSR